MTGTVKFVLGDDIRRASIASFSAACLADNAQILFGEKLETGFDLTYLDDDGDTCLLTEYTAADFEIHCGDSLGIKSAKLYVRPRRPAVVGAGKCLVKQQEFSDALDKNSRQDLSKEQPIGDGDLDRARPAHLVWPVIETVAANLGNLDGLEDVSSLMKKAWKSADTHILGVAISSFVDALAQFEPDKRKFAVSVMADAMAKAVSTHGPSTHSGIAPATVSPGSQPKFWQTALESSSAVVEGPGHGRIQVNPTPMFPCMGCMEKMSGQRWKCTKCSGYNLCSPCHCRKHEFHDEGHTFVFIPARRGRLSACKARAWANHVDAIADSGSARFESSKPIETDKHSCQIETDKHSCQPLTLGARKSVDTNLSLLDGLEKHGNPINVDVAAVSDSAHFERSRPIETDKHCCQPLTSGARNGENPNLPPPNDLTKFEKPIAASSLSAWRRRFFSNAQAR